MIDIIVQRAAGDRPGSDIVEPLLGSVPAALSRGRAEIDADDDADDWSTEPPLKLTPFPRAESRNDNHAPTSTRPRAKKKRAKTGGRS